MVCQVKVQPLSCSDSTDALEKFVRTPNTVLLSNNPKVFFVLKIYPIAFWTERDVQYKSCDEVRLPTQNVQCNPLWFFWPISLFVAFDTCQIFHCRDSKNFLFFHLMFLQEFLSFLKNTEIVFLNTYAGATDDFLFSKCNPTDVRFPHYTLMIHWVIPWILHRDILAWAFETKQFSKEFIWTEVEKNQPLLLISGRMQNLPTFTQGCLCLVFAFSFCQGK